MMPYEGLKAWQCCHELFLAIYRVTERFPQGERYGLTAQMRRAAFSAAANLAEGSAKRGAREFRRYIDITLGSLSELSYAIRAVQDLELGPVDDVRRLDELRQQAGRLTWGLYRRVCARAGEGP
jgi:four helix bundle protein